MCTIFEGGTVYRHGRLEATSVSVSGGLIVSGFPLPLSGSRVSVSGKVLIPGFVDVHVHLREPGFLYKESIGTGTRAAARGGYTAVCAMPNLDPVPDSLPHIQTELDAIERDACVHVYPYAALTRGRQGAGEPCDFAALAPYAVAFSDDGTGVQSESTMRAVMERVKTADGLIAAHCEANTLLHGGCIHDGDYARAHDLPGISSESEWRMVERDLRLARETGCRYHVCHVSCKESVALIRQARREGVDVTCETAPHYLLLDDSMLQDDGRFKMNPPVRGKADREALVEGLLDGTITVIATDHAPHSAEEKAKGLRNSLMGVVGLETALPVLYTGLVKPGVVPLCTLLRAMTDAPRERFRLPPMEFSPGQAADFSVWDLSEQTVVNPDTFLSKGRATPFAGWPVQGQCEQTIVGGKTVWKL